MTHFHSSIADLPAGKGGKRHIGIEIGPKNCGTQMRPDDLSIAFDGPGGL
jgi:hypothetical protein